MICTNFDAICSHIGLWTRSQAQVDTGVGVGVGVDVGVELLWDRPVLSSLQFTNFLVSIKIFYVSMLKDKRQKFYFIKFSQGVASFVTSTQLT